MGIAFLVIYAGLLVFVAFLTARKQSQADFYVNSRRSSALGVGMSIVVSCVGASATLGMIGMAFDVGVPAVWWLGAGSLGLVLLSLLLAGKVRESNARTMPELVETFLGKQARPLISVLIVLAWSAILAAQFTALLKVLQSMSGLPTAACLGIGYLFVVLHTMGGQAAIMKADRFQTLILFVSVAVLLMALWGENPGWAGLVELEATNKAFPPERLLWYVLVVGANYLVCPMLFGRLLSARDGRSARLGGLLGAAGIAVCAVVIVCIGLSLRGIVPPGTAPDAALTTALAKYVPAWLNIVVSIALISAIVSSADSCLVTAATVLSHDLLQRPDLRTAKICVAALGLAGLLLSLWGKGILDYLLMAYDVYACGVVAPVFVGLLLVRKRRVDARFACLAVAAGGILGGLSALTGKNFYSYIGMGLSAAIALCGSRLKTPDSPLGRGTAEPGAR